MGITGLLKGLQFCSQKRHIRDFSNQVLAVDASSWLHKSVYSVSERYVESLDTGRLDQACVQVATKYIVARCQELLLHADIAHIYLVLDGKRCPLKAQTNQDREERRQKNLADARRYKQAGRPDKAQEKYKACIKISSQMADAVADAVTRRFANDTRVQCVYSPYEADSQLVKLCMDRIAHAVVTEDSDVLVYSASCNFSFPILYKLERDTGACDVITMDWLLNPNAQPNWTQPANGKKQKGGGALESILKSLVSRQSRRPGVGARLFVQACVLAGCDYCPSQLNGVGLVTAFKLVRDNAHRQPADRFRKALKSLSKKARSNINVTEYEELLSKSEAVFYHHPILDMNSKRIIPLIVPRTTEEPNSAELQMVSDSHPSLYRFQGDWSFLGTFTTAGGLKQDDDNDDDAVPISEIVIQHGKSKVAPAVYDGGDAAVSAITRNVAVVNPYAKTKKRKRTDDGADGTVRAPLTTIERTNEHSQSSSTNLFAHFAHKKTAKSSQSRQQQPSAGHSMYFQNRQDVRFVKRNFRAKPPSYAQMLSENGSQRQQRKPSRGDSQSSGQSSSGPSRRREDEQPHYGFTSERVDNADASTLTNSYHQAQTAQVDGQERNQHDHHQRVVGNIFEHEGNSFCYSEIDSRQASTSHNMHQQPIDQSFAQEANEMRAQEWNDGSISGYEPRYDRDTNTEALPFGNPDFTDDVRESSTHYSIDQQSAPPRRVTLEDSNEALYDELNVAANGNGRQFHEEEEIDEYHSENEGRVVTGRHPSNAMAEDHTRTRPAFEGASSKYFQHSARDETASCNEFDAPHINGNDSVHDDPEDAIDESTLSFYAAPLSSRMPLARHNTNTSRFGNAADGCSSVSSCEDIASPENQEKARSYYNQSWAGKHAQENQVLEPARQPQLAPIFQAMTSVTGTPVQPSSPLSVTSNPRNTLNIQSRPAFRTQAPSRGRNSKKGSTTHRPAKRGAITDFFKLKSSPNDNEFARF